MIFILLTLCLMGFYNTNISAHDTENLVALVQLFRHGERAPLRFYKNDPHQNFWKPAEMKQLTKKGRQQLHTLGKLTRDRYSNWIPRKYEQNFIRAETTDVDRTHISGQTFLYGLFPAEDDQVWLEGVNWQAIPLHPIDPKFNPLYDDHNKYYKEFMKTDEIVALEEEYKDVFSYLTQQSGDEIKCIYDAFQLYDTLKIEEGVGLALPEWTQTVYPHPLQELAGIRFRTITNTTKLKVLYMKPGLTQILDFFDKYNSTDLRYRVYSVHDNHISAILDCFGSFDPCYPPEFAATIWIELRKNGEQLYVNVWSKNGDNIIPISIKGCDLDCPLEEVKEKLDEIINDLTITPLNNYHVLDMEYWHLH